MLLFLIEIPPATTQLKGQQNADPSQGCFALDDSVLLTKPDKRLQEEGKHHASPAHRSPLASCLHPSHVRAGCC